jgi:hypothetical protein
MSLENFIEQLASGFWIAAIIGLILGLFTHYLFKK